MGSFQSSKFSLFFLDAHFKVPVCLSQTSHMRSHLCIWFGTLSAAGSSFLSHLANLTLLFDNFLLKILDQEEMYRRVWFFAFPLSNLFTTLLAPFKRPTRKSQVSGGMSVM